MRRPASVIFVAVLQFAAATAAGVVAFSLMVPGTDLDRMWDLNPPVHAALQDGGTWVAVILLGVGVLAVIAGVGLLARQVWAWMLSVAVFAFNALGELLNLTQGSHGALTGIAIDAFFLFLLLQPKVRKFFLARP